MGAVSGNLIGKITTEGTLKGTISLPDGFDMGYEAGQKAGYTEGYAAGEESRYVVEDELIAKTLTTYQNQRPVTIGNRMFSYCYNLVSVDLPNAVSVEQYAFTYCTALKKIVLPSATEIAPFAFQNCTNLTVADIWVANSLNSNAFSNTNLTTLILRRTDKITTNGSTAMCTNTPIANGTGLIYVPDNLVEQYKAATNWKTYANQIKPLSELEE